MDINYKLLRQLERVYIFLTANFDLDHPMVVEVREAIKLAKSEF